MFLASLVAAFLLSLVLHEPHGKNFIAANIFTLPLLILGWGGLFWCYPAFVRHWTFESGNYRWKQLRQDIELMGTDYWMVAGLGFGGLILVMIMGLYTLGVATILTGPTLLCIFVIQAYAVGLMQAKYFVAGADTDEESEESDDDEAQG